MADHRITAGKYKWRSGTLDDLFDVEIRRIEQAEQECRELTEALRRRYPAWILTRLLTALAEGSCAAAATALKYKLRNREQADG